nr:asparagine synthase (glutamine-hydrolyzing) [Microbispora sp. ATCC PTA-5024]
MAGIVSTAAADAGQVRLMCDALAHRGPDAAGHHEGGRAALGSRRLAVVDVPGGGQPVYNDGTVVAVFHGELYNFRELRGRLAARGHRFASDGDTECLVHAYEEFGDDLVHELHGMYAFAIWDGRRERLLLARDRLGKKPLYWRSEGDSLAFASELKALLRGPVAAGEVDPVALHHYLTYGYVPAPWSIHCDVRKVPPGHLLTRRAGETDVARYWRLDCAPRPAGDEDEEAERLRVGLLDATRMRMVSERPLGAFLSGGLDSSAVAAAMARQSAEPVRTFTIGFDDDDFDERRYARLVARRYGTEHHELVVTPSVTDMLPTLSWHFDEPFADSSAIPSLYLARMSRSHVTVVLNGDGGDECLGGYRGTPRWPPSGASPCRGPPGRCWRGQGPLSPGAPGPPRGCGTPGGSSSSSGCRPPGGTPASCRASPRRAAGRAFAPWLPAPIVGRRKKGFGVPLAAWLRTGLRELSRDVLTDHTARSRGLFRPESVERLLRAHEAGQDHGPRIWALVQLELWYRTYAS